MKRAVLWLLYDDWGQKSRTYGFERIEETAPYRQKPEALQKAAVIHIDASGWGGRASFLYQARERTVNPAGNAKASLERLPTIRLSIQTESAHYVAKVWWGNQLFFLKLKPTTDGGAIVAEFTDHWITGGKRPK